MLQDIIEELAKPEYDSLSDIEALEAIKNSSEFIQGPAQAGNVLSYLAQISKLIEVKSISETNGHLLQNASEAIMITLNGRTQFDVHKPEVQAMLQGFVDASVISTNERDGILAIGQTPKFENCTLRQIRQARGKTNTQTIGGWKAGGAIRVNVVGELLEPVRPTVTKTNDLYTNEPVGRTVNISSEGSYIIDLTGLRTLGNAADLTIELGASNSFTVEMV
ncbi:hypothetical protein CL622_04490 [archaeon]|nr:hypothetical protein [archaeon]